MRQYERLEQNEKGMLLSHLYAMVAHGRTVRNINDEPVDLVPHLRSCRLWCYIPVVAERLCITVACAQRLLEDDAQLAELTADERRLLQQKGKLGKGRGSGGHHWRFADASDGQTTWFRSSDVTAQLGSHVAGHTCSHPGAHVAYDAALRALGPDYEVCNPPDGLALLPDSLTGGPLDWQRRAAQPPALAAAAQAGAVPRDGPAAAMPGGHQ